MDGEARAWHQRRMAGAYISVPCETEGCGACHGGYYGSVGAARRAMRALAVMHVPAEGPVRCWRHRAEALETRVAALERRAMGSGGRGDAEEDPRGERGEVPGEAERGARRPPEPVDEAQRPGAGAEVLS